MQVLERVLCAGAEGHLLWGALQLQPDMQGLKVGIVCADPLRVLRAIRFGARFGFRLDEELEHAAASEPVRQPPACTSCIASEQSQDHWQSSIMAWTEQTADMLLLHPRA